jgi:hypothetical protein
MTAGTDLARHAILCAGLTILGACTLLGGGGCGTSTNGRASSAQSFDASVDGTPDIPGSANGGDRGDDAAAAQPDPTPADEPDASVSPIVDAGVDAEVPPLLPAYCGNAQLDPGEECDPGADYAPPACAYGCQALDFLPKPDGAAAPDAGARSRGTGPAHPLAASAEGGFALASVERVDGAVRVVVDAFGAGGRPRGASQVLASGVNAVAQANAVVAALPGGRFAAAWSDLGGDGDELGVAIALVDPTPGAPAPSRHFANTVSLGVQRDADIVFTGSQVVVAWVDESNAATGADLKLRTFDAALKPTSDEQPLAVSADSESDVTLAAFAGSYAAAWRSSAGGVETVHVRAGGNEWPFALAAAGPAGDRPALVELDATHLLLTYSEGGALDSSDSSHLRAALIDTAAVGPVLPFDVDVASGASGDAPVLAVVGDAAFLAWHTAATPGDPNGEEVLLKGIPIDRAGVLDATKLDWSSLVVPLARQDAHRRGDQRLPALASTGRELLSTWADLGVSFGGREWHGDVAMNVSSMPGARAPDTMNAVDASRYAARLQALFCRHLADCCLVPTQFDYAGCQAGNTSAAVTAATPLLGNGNVGVSRAGIDACVHANVDTACAFLDADALHTMDHACGGSIVGRIAMGASGCTDDVECVPGSYCAPADGAGTRTCVAWKHAGQTCDAPTACTPLGPPYEYCADTASCARTKAIGEACQTYSECSSGICDGLTSVCLASTPLADPGVPGGFCDAFTLKDAGTP